MTTTGDNKSGGRAEAQDLLGQLIASRLPLVSLEIAWALDQPTPEDFRKPPPWVKKAICEVFGHKQDSKKKPQISAADIAGFFGVVSGLADGARAMLSDPSLSADIPPHNQASFEAMKEGFAGALRPSLAKATELADGLPKKLSESSVENMAAYAKGQSEATAYIFTAAKSDSPLDSVSAEIIWLLWLAWPQVQTASSVNDIHLWFERMGLIHCSPKLVEKICRRIGLRPSGRGRKKRIPTNRD